MSMETLMKNISAKAKANNPEDTDYVPVLQTPRDPPANQWKQAEKFGMGAGPSATPLPKGVGGKAIEISAAPLGQLDGIRGLTGQTPAVKLSQVEVTELERMARGKNTNGSSKLVAPSNLVSPAIKPSPVNWPKASGDRNRPGMLGVHDEEGSQDGRSQQAKSHLDLGDMFSPKTVAGPMDHLSETVSAAGDEVLTPPGSRGGSRGSQRNGRLLAASRRNKSKELDEARKQEILGKLFADNPFLPPTRAPGALGKFQRVAQKQIRRKTAGVAAAIWAGRGDRDSDEEDEVGGQRDYFTDDDETEIVTEDMDSDAIERLSTKLGKMGTLCATFARLLVSLQEKYEKKHDTDKIRARRMHSDAKQYFRDSDAALRELTEVLYSRAHGANEVETVIKAGLKPSCVFLKLVAERTADMCTHKYVMDLEFREQVGVSSQLPIVGTLVGDIGAAGKGIIKILRDLHMEEEKEEQRNHMTSSSSDEEPAARRQNIAFKREMNDVLNEAGTQPTKTGSSGKRLASLFNSMRNASSVVPIGGFDGNDNNDGSVGNGGGSDSDDESMSTEELSDDKASVYDRSVVGGAGGRVTSRVMGRGGTVAGSVVGSPARDHDIAESVDNDSAAGYMQPVFDHNPFDADEQDQALGYRTSRPGTAASHVSHSSARSGRSFTNIGTAGKTKPKRAAPIMGLGSPNQPSKPASVGRSLVEGSGPTPLPAAMLGQPADSLDDMDELDAI